MADKKVRVSKGEKIANDFLLQFAYGIASSIILLFIYNGSLFKYGGGIGSAMPKVLWSLFALCAVAGAVFMLLYKKKNINGYKIAAIYLFVSACGFFWCVGLQQIAYYIKQFIPFAGFFANTKRLMEMLFIIIGLSVIAEIGVYFYRIKKLKTKRVKNKRN